ncbi:hypothetical protein Plhal304r1_c031g0101281 [Plasmopara halstedii]
MASYNVLKAVMITIHGLNLISCGWHRDVLHPPYPFHVINEIRIAFQGRLSCREGQMG